LIQLCVFTPSLFAGWFFGDNYYEISYKFSGGYTRKAMAIGEPWSEGPFTVYTSYPDKKEVKIKTEHIMEIVDTGTKSPEELKIEKFQILEKIFGNTPEDLKASYNRPNISLARSKKIKNRDIFNFLCSINKEYRKFDRFGDYMGSDKYDPPIEDYIPPKSSFRLIDESDSGRKKIPFDPNQPFEEVNATIPQSAPRKGLFDDLLEEDAQKKNLAESKGDSSSSKSGRGGTSSEFGWYHDLIHERFFSQWEQPTSIFKQDKSFVCVVKIHIGCDGTIKSSEIVSSSLNMAMDQSVQAALGRVTKIDPLPTGLGSGDGYTVNINFELQ
jgi:hypothetical protein